MYGVSPLPSQTWSTKHKLHVHVYSISLCINIINDINKTGPNKQKKYNAKHPASFSNCYIHTGGILAGGINTIYIIQAHYTLVHVTTAAACTL